MNPVKTTLAAAFAASTLAAPAFADDTIHGWSEPSLAEFTMENVRTKFLYPAPHHYRNQDVHIDCGLIINNDGQPIVPVGFIAQFNAETQETLDQLAPGALEILQNYKGSLDYRSQTQGGVLTHLDGQHEINMQQVRQAAQRCWTEYRSHATRYQDLTNHGPHHNDYTPD